MCLYPGKNFTIFSIIQTWGKLWRLWDVIKDILLETSDEEDDDKEAEDEDEQWDSSVVINTNKLPKFTANPGLQKDLPENPFPLEYFQLFLTDEIVEHIVPQTNLHAEQAIAAATENGNPSPSSRQNKWQPTDADELKLFIALIFGPSLFWVFVL